MTDPISLHNFSLASPHWELSGTIPCLTGAYGSGVTHLLNMLELSVGMGLMSSIFACNVRLKKRKSDIMHSGWFDCYCVDHCDDCVDCVDFVLFYYRFE